MEFKWNKKLKKLDIRKKKRPNQKVFFESDDEFAEMVRNTAKSAKKSSYSRIDSLLEEINLIREYLLSIKEDLDKGWWFYVF